MLTTDPDPVEALRARREAVTDGLLTHREACRALKISRWTLYRWADEGRLRSVYIDGLGYVPETDVIDYIARLEAQRGLD